MAQLITLVRLNTRYECTNKQIPVQWSTAISEEIVDTMTDMI